MSHKKVRFRNWLCCFRFSATQMNPWLVKSRFIDYFRVSSSQYTLQLLYLYFEKWFFKTPICLHLVKWPGISLKKKSPKLVQFSLLSIVFMFSFSILWYEKFGKRKISQIYTKKTTFLQKFPNFWVKNNKILLKEINGTYVMETCEEKKTHEEREAKNIHNIFIWLPTFIPT